MPQPQHKSHKCGACIGVHVTRSVVVYAPWRAATRRGAMCWGAFAFCLLCLRNSVAPLFFVGRVARGAIFVFLCGSGGEMGVCDGAGPSMHTRHTGLGSRGLSARGLSTPRVGRGAFAAQGHTDRDTGTGDPGAAITPKMSYTHTPRAGTAASTLQLHYRLCGVCAWGART
jgi:hypothetical protein